MGAAEIRRTALRDADVSDFPFSALGLGKAVVGARGGGGCGGILDEGSHLEDCFFDGRFGRHAVPVRSAS